MPSYTCAVHNALQWNVLQIVYSVLEPLLKGSFTYFGWSRYVRSIL